MKYIINLHATDNGKVQIKLHRMDGSRGEGMPYGSYDTAEQAGTAAQFLQSALHDQYMAGMTAAYDRAMGIICKAGSEPQS